MLPDVFWLIDAIKQEDTAGLRELEDVETLQERELVASNKVGLIFTNQIGCGDEMRTEAQVRDGDRA